MQVLPGPRHLLRRELTPGRRVEAARAPRRTGLRDPGIYLPLLALVSKASTSAHSFRQSARSGSGKSSIGFWSRTPSNAESCSHCSRVCTTVAPLVFESLSRTFVHVASSPLSHCRAWPRTRFGRIARGWDVLAFSRSRECRGAGGVKWDFQLTAFGQLRIGRECVAPKRRCQGVKRFIVGPLSQFESFRVVLWFGLAPGHGGEFRSRATSTGSVFSNASRSRSTSARMAGSLSSRPAFSRFSRIVFMKERNCG